MFKVTEYAALNALSYFRYTLNRSYKWLAYIFRLFRKYKSLKQHLILYKIQGFVETLQIMSFQNDW